MSGSRPTSSDERARRTAARDLFARFLEQHESGDAQAFAALTAAHPDLAPRLAKLYASWSRVDAAFAEQRVGAESDPAGPAGPAAAEAQRYREARRLAVGGMGEVDEVFDKELGRAVARKTLRADGRGPEPRQLGRFLDEARITAQLEHPGIVPVHDVGVGPDGRPFFTMTLVRGESLAEGLRRLRAGDPGWDRTRALGILIRVCEDARR